MRFELLEEEVEHAVVADPDAAAPARVYHPVAAALHRLVIVTGPEGEPVQVGVADRLHAAALETGGAVAAGHEGFPVEAGVVAVVRQRQGELPPQGGPLVPYPQACRDLVEAEVHPGDYGVPGFAAVAAAGVAFLVEEFEKRRRPPGAVLVQREDLAVPVSRGERETAEQILLAQDVGG